MTDLTDQRAHLGYKAEVATDITDQTEMFCETVSVGYSINLYFLHTKNIWCNSQSL